MFHERMDTIAESWDFCDQIAKHYAKGHSTYIVEKWNDYLEIVAFGRYRTRYL